MDLVINHAVAHSIAAMIQANTPLSHDDLNAAFSREGLQRGDPGQKDQHGHPIGKHRRVKAVLTYAADNEPRAGGRLVGYLLQRLRGAGCFRKDGPAAITDELVENARASVRSSGYDLLDDGTLAPRVLDGLGGRDLSDALGLYVQRAQAGATDAAQLAGTGKDLVEATARHVLVERTGAYNRHMDLPGTLLNAMLTLGSTLDSARAMAARDQLSQEPIAGLHEAVYVMALCVNRLRNAEGTGHGRPYLPSVSGADARTATEASGFVAGFLLERLRGEAGL